MAGLTDSNSLLLSGRVEDVDMDSTPFSFTLVHDDLRVSCRTCSPVLANASGCPSCLCVGYLAHDMVFHVKNISVLDTDCL